METNEVLKQSSPVQTGLKRAMHFAVFTAIVLFASGLLLNAQPTSEELNSNENHELTIYVLKSASPLNWESPEMLYKTYRNSVLTNFLKKERTLKGHFFIRLQTPLLDEILYAGITSENRNEEKRWMFVKKIGLGVFGINMKGAIQGRDALLKKIEVHARKNDIAYLKIRISESAAQRLIDFYNIYTTDIIPDYARSDFYGGAFWPLYENEGSGCSAFALAMLKLVNVEDFETDKWQKPINIPMDLIGGELNNSKKIKVRDIKKTKSWHDGNGVENVDFVPYNLCDPTTAYYWILEHQKPDTTSTYISYLPDSESGIPGLFTDKSNVEIDPAEPIITKRPKKDFFVEYHNHQIEKLVQKQDSIPLAGINQIEEVKK